MRYKRRRGLGGARSERPTTRMGEGQRRALVTLGIVVGCIGAGYVISSLLISPSSAAAGDTTVVHVPDLVGLPEADARARVTEAGLEFTVRGGLAHREIPEGAVLAQSPLPDQFARPGAPVAVTLSRGPEVHTLPDVAGLSERQAVIVLERLGYEVEIERRENALAAGRAVETRPEAGSSLAVPSPLVLVVSEGAPIVVVPDMLGLHIDDALQVLNEHNLELGSISFDAQAREAPGRIVGQYPPVGYSLRAGDAMELRVAGDPDQVNEDPRLKKEFIRRGVGSPVNWRRTFLDNLGFKLAALVIVALLWISVTADERQAQPVPTRVTYQVTDSAWVLVQGPTVVSTTFQGRNRELLGLLMDEPVVTVQIDSVEGPDMNILIPLDQVAYDRDLGVVPSFITPDELTLRFERRVSARIAVVADVEVMPAAGFTVLTPILVEPESVTVRGPASWLQDLRRISTRRVELEAVSNTVLRDVGLRVPANVQGVEIEPPSVLVTVNLDSLMVGSRRVPLRLSGAGSARAVADTDSVNVFVRGAASVVSAHLTALQEIVLELQDTPMEPVSHSLSVSLDGGGPVAASIEPETVMIRPRS